MTRRQPLSVLAPTLFSFFRHTITSVRLAVVKTLHSFLSVSSLPHDWIGPPLLRLLFQNLIVEEKLDIRNSTLELWELALRLLRSVDDWMESVVSPDLILEWFQLAMTPLGVPIDPKLLFYPSMGLDSGGPAPERHNVDKNMLAQDLALVSTETVLRARVASAKAFACLLALWPQQGQPLDDLFRPMLEHYILSPSMMQKFLGAITVEEWALKHEEVIAKDEYPDDEALSLSRQSSLAQQLGKHMLVWLQSDPPVAYHEMALSLSRIFNECSTLLQSFVHDCKIPQHMIPSLGQSIDITGAEEGAFTLVTAQNVIGPIFTQLKDSLGRTKKKEVAALQEKRLRVEASIQHYSDIKNQHDIRVSAAFAAAYVALELAPEKVSPIVKGIMNGIKNEENIDLQTRSATAVAAFIAFCSKNKLSQPPEKIVKNLCTFLCQDVEQTPTFAFSKTTEKGVLSFKSASQWDGTSGRNGSKGQGDTEESTKARLSRRGAELAFKQLSAKFGEKLFELIPKIWEFMAGGLQTTFASGKFSYKLYGTFIDFV